MTLRCIKHRAVDEFTDLPQLISLTDNFVAGDGFEIDVRLVRDYERKDPYIIISHEPVFALAQEALQDLESFLESLTKLKDALPVDIGYVAINIKEQGIARWIDIALKNSGFKKSGIPYFVFDSIVPDLFQYQQLGIPYLLRVSPFEGSYFKNTELKPLGFWVDFLHLIEGEERERFMQNIINRSKEVLHVIAYPDLSGKKEVHLDKLLKYENKNIVICTKNPKEVRKRRLELWHTPSVQ